MNVALLNACCAISCWAVKLGRRTRTLSTDLLLAVATNMSVTLLGEMRDVVKLYYAIKQMSPDSNKCYQRQTCCLTHLVLPLL